MPRQNQKRCAIYARVSTREQTTRNQVRQLREYARLRRFRLLYTITEKQSGATDSRPELNRLMTLVRQRKVDVVLVWKFDRFGRTIRHLVTALEEFRDLGVDFVSLTESIDTTTASGRAFFGMVSVMAQFEKDVIRERTLAGLDRARADGKRLGRPRIPDDVVARIRKLRRTGFSYRRIAAAVGRPLSVVVDYANPNAKRARAPTPNPTSGRPPGR